ncbi:MAG: 5'/3'-nucleotidase SurE [Paracoccaceae bacterium]|nr:5'/3'-nucleotidase SurE [Paracoccaceae bacterium]
MRILLTNDDGINAPGLEVMEAIAREVAGPSGEVWVVAPAFEQSGVGHCISYTHPTLLSQFGPRRFAAEGTPADCVMAAVHEVMKDAPPDLVLSGVNKGNNAGESTVYSGTVGAAMEAALQDLPAIALSQYFGPATRDLDTPFQASVAFGVETVQSLLADGLWEGSGYRLFYNVNFPPVPADHVKGRRIVRQAWREGWRHGMTAQTAPTGRSFLWVNGSSAHMPAPEGTDVAANLDGYIAITPLRADLTAHETLEALQTRLDT